MCIRDSVDSMPVKEKIARFKANFDDGEEHTGHEFFEWHGILTGSCEFGRKSFVANDS